ncbi:MAG: ABC transporter permease [Candidatus Omnitrophica bacterium]|nr:ABC transporter permease [Candidatus Omnitrophota bacterium]
MIYLAIRYLLERKKQTLLTLLGVFLGSMAYVAVSGFFMGFQGFMIQQLVNNAAQIHIQARQDYLTEHQLDGAFYGRQFRHVFWLSPPSGVEGYLGIQNPQSWYERLKADPRVEAFSPLLTAPALFTLSKYSVSANLIGCDPGQQGKVTSVAEYMIEGQFSDIGVGGNRIILGDELMKRLGAGLGQTLLVAVKTNPPVPFKVVGRFLTGNRASDLQAYGSLNDVQKINGTPNQVNEIGVRLKDYSQAGAIARNWSSIAPERTESWDQQNASILSVMKLQTVLRWTMTMTVIIVAGFGIYNILNMTVTQKRQDIAILRSMGYDTFDVIMLFFSQGLIIGICGGVLGLIFGYFVCLYLQTVPFSGGLTYDPRARLHISLSAGIYIQALLLSLLSSTLASILPARAASKFTPIEIIRSGA